MAGSFKEILARKLQDRDLTYEALAAKVGVSGVYISRIIQGRAVPSEEVIYKLCAALDLDLSETLLLARYEKAPEKVKPVYRALRLAKSGTSKMFGQATELDNLEPATLGHGSTVPVVGMVAAGAFSPAEDGEYPAGSADAYVYTDRKGKNLFAVRVISDSMEPEFREGDILIVNPNLEARSGDFVIAKMVQDNEATFKKLVLHERVIILRPLNPLYGDIVVMDPSRVKIIGKVVERKTLY